MSDYPHAALHSGLADTAFPIEDSVYYRFRQEERAAIDEHKWFLSEKAGHDVGLSYAGWNWIMGGHRARWLASRRATP
jgi:hypothetical protein